MTCKPDDPNDQSVIDEPRRSTRCLARSPRQRRNRPPRQPTKSAETNESALLDRLRHHALGAADMTSTQVRAAEVALKKAEAENHAVRAIISDQPLSEEEWRQKYVR